MSAAGYIGRVGGLAVALGIGTAVLTGHGVASAEPTAGAETSSREAADPSGSAPKVAKSRHGSTGAEASGSAANTDHADDADGGDADAADKNVDNTGTGDDAKKNREDNTDLEDRSDRSPSEGPADNGSSTDDVQEDVVPASPAASREGATGAEGTRVPAAAAAGSAAGDRQTEAAVWLASPAAVAGRAPAAPVAQKPATAAIANPLLDLIGNVLNLFAGDGPSAPLSNSPLSWAAAAAARREALAVGGPIAVDPTFDFDNGVIYGSVGATDSRGRPLVYTLIDNPDQGGKVTLNPDGTFSFLPDLSVVDARGIEQFTVMVSEKTWLVSLLEQVPILGDIVSPIVLGLQQVPILGALLQPIIGYRVMAPIDVNVGDLVPTGAPVAFTTMVTSFDGTQISTNFFPATGLGVGDIAPTVLNGPGLGSAGNIDPTSLTTVFDLVPGLMPLRDAGYNVVTWDPRGEFASGGVLQLDNPFFEGRDVQAIIDWVATRPETELDAPGDPTMGMVGGSYGGGIQLVTAGIDDRIEAIVPVIAWNSLIEALYPGDAFKSGWATLLGLDLLEAGARINSQIYPAIILGDLLGFITESQRAILESSGPTVLVSSITAPTLLIQGTADGLFTLAQAVTNAMLLDANGVPVEMIWACGGHGTCLDTLNPLQTPFLVNSTVDWLDRYVRGDELVPTGPRFEWFDQNGVYHSSDLLPSDPEFYGDPLVTTGDGGFLPIIPILGGSGPQTKSPTPLIESPALASEAWLALNVDIPAAATVTEVVGAPELTLTYSGLGTGSHIYGQLVDEVTGLVLGNLVTPIPVTLNGRSQTVTVELEQIAYTMTPGTKLKLQLVGFATPYFNVTQVGYIDVESVTLSLPTVAVPATEQSALAGMTLGMTAA